MGVGVQSGTLSFHVAGFSKPLTFHNGFMFFVLLVAVSSTFRDFKPYLFHISSRALFETSRCSTSFMEGVGPSTPPVEDLPRTTLQRFWLFNIPCPPHEHSEQRELGLGNGEAAHQG